MRETLRAQGICRGLSVDMRHLQLCSLYPLLMYCVVLILPIVKSTVRSGLREIECFNSSFIENELGVGGGFLRMRGREAPKTLRSN